MNKIQCANGHFYDGDQYASCPHCAEGLPPVDAGAFAVDHKETPLNEDQKKHEKSEKKVEKKHEKKPEKDAAGKHGQKPDDKTEKKEKTEKTTGLGGLFHKKGKPAQDVQKNPPAASSHGSVEPVTVPAQEAESQNSAQPQNTDVTQPRGTQPQGTQPQGTQPQGTQPQGTQPQGTQPQGTQPQGTQSQGTQPTEPATLSLQQVVDQITVGTSIPYPDDGPSDDTVTRRIYPAGMETEPPVGFAVCVEGEDFGKGFPLRAGNNSIGRSKSMDVVLLDPKVSREQHGDILYEPHKREFYLIPGKSSGFCYFHEEAVWSPVQLKAHDVITLGDTKLMLVPVCDEKFGWEDVSR